MSGITPYVCDIRAEWRLKCIAETKIYLEQFSGRIGCFKGLTVPFDKMTNKGKVAFD